jgi:hypothetical protein
MNGAMVDTLVQEYVGALTEVDYFLRPPQVAELAAGYGDGLDELADIYGDVINARSPRGVSEDTVNEVARVVRAGGPNEELPSFVTTSVSGVIDRYLVASGALGGALRAYIPSEPGPAGPRSAVRRLAASAAGDLLVAGFLASLVGAEAGLGSPAPEDEDQAQIPRFVSEVAIGVSGPLEVRGAATADSLRTSLNGAIDNVMAAGDATISKVVRRCFFGVIFDALFEGLGSVAAVVEHLSDQSALGWMLKKVYRIVDLAREKLLAVVGADRMRSIAATTREELRVVAETQAHGGLDLLLSYGARRLYDVEGLRRLADTWVRELDRDPGESSLAGVEERLSPVLDRIPEDARLWLQWAEVGAFGVRLARVAVHGPARAGLYVAGGLLTLYTLFVIQDHLDWPQVTLFPDFATGIRAAMQRA